MCALHIFCTDIPASCILRAATHTKKLTECSCEFDKRFALSNFGCLAMYSMNIINRGCVPIKMNSNKICQNIGPVVTRTCSAGPKHAWQLNISTLSSSVREYIIQRGVKNIILIYRSCEVSGCDNYYLMIAVAMYTNNNNDCERKDFKILYNSQLLHAVMCIILYIYIFFFFVCTVIESGLILRLLLCLSSISILQHTT